MRPLPALLLLASLLLLPATPVRAVAGEEDGALPPYALPEGLSGTGGLTPALEAAVTRAVADATRPSSPWSASEGWRVLAGIGPAAAPAAVAALPGADWFGRALLVRALGAMETPALEPLLVQAAGDPSWPVRAAAAEGLGFLDGAPSARVLPGLLRDGAWRVRRAAVEGLRRRALRGTFPRDTAAEEFLPLAADPDEDVRRAAWLALADLREPRAREALRDALAALADRVEARSEMDAPDPEQATAVRLLRGLSEGFGEDPDIRDLLREFGRNPAHPLAGAGLREWFRRSGPAGREDAGALHDLVTVFLDPATDADSRAAAEEAVVEIGEPAAAALLARISTPERARNPSPLLEYGAARNVLRLVLRLRGGRAAETLETVLRDGGLSSTLRKHAAELGRRTCPVALGKAFRELLASREGGAGFEAELLKGAAASGGADLPALLALHLVRREGDDPPLHLRAAAAEILERRPDLREPGTLRAALASETDGEVLGRILRILPESEGAAALGILARFQGDPRMQVRMAAVQGLGSLRGAEVVEALLGHLSAEDGSDDRLPWHGGEPPTDAAAAEREAVKEANAGSVRGAVVSSLRFAAGEEARPRLEALLSHGDPAVRGSAASNLATLGDPAVRARLLEALATHAGPAAAAAYEGYLASPDGDLRAAALAALDGENVRAGAPRGLRALVEDAAADPVDRLDALRALGRSADPALAPFLRARLAAAATPEERRLALQALGRGRDPGSVAPVAALLPAGPAGALDDDAFDTGTTAVEALGDLRSPDAVPHLAALLRRALPPALSGGVGRRENRDRQVAALCFQSLGKCGGEAALETLVAAAFHPGFSRAAETATTNPLRPPIPRREGERWRPEMPSDLLPAAEALVRALARWKDPELAGALARHLEGLRADGRVHALGEEWMTWLGDRLATPPPRSPARPRWWAKVVLARQVVANPPRLTEADQAASYTLWSHGSSVSMEYAAARRDLRRWREAMALHEPMRLERERRALDGLDAVAAAGEALRAKVPGATAAPMRTAFEEGGREDAVARLGVEILDDLGLHPGDAVALGEGAVASHASYVPNLRSLGEARLAAGDAEGAVEMLLLALEESESVNYEGGMQRTTAWTRFHLGRALEACGERAQALRRLGEAALLGDVVLDWIDRVPGLEELRKDPLFEEAMRPAREAFGE